MDADLITLTQAAQLAKCDRATVWRAIQRGQLSGQLIDVPFNHSAWYVNRADLEMWAAARHVKKGEKIEG